MNIFDNYSAYQLRQIFAETEWPEDFKKWVHEEIAYELLDSWLSDIDDDIYRDRVRNIVEDMTYGYKDEDGKEMLDFVIDNKENE